MNRKHALFLLAAALGAGCGGSDAAPFEVVTASDAKPGTDFCAFDTFDFYDFTQIPGGQPIQPDSVSYGDQVSQEQITAQLTSLGLTQDTTTPDLKINRSYFADTSTHLQNVCVPVGDWWGYWWGYDCSWLVAVDYQIGTMIVDLVAQDGDELVFRGGAQSAVQEGDGTKTINKRITIAMDQIFGDDYAALISSCQ